MIERYTTPDMAAEAAVPMYIELLDPGLADEIHQATWLGYQASLDMDSRATASMIEPYIADVMPTRGLLSGFTYVSASGIAEQAYDRVVSRTTYEGLRRVLAYRRAGMALRAEDAGLADMLDK